MTFDKNEIAYRRATSADIETLVEMRVRFLNEMYDHPDDGETEELRTSLRRYFAESVSSGSFVAWLAERGEEVVGTSGMVVWRFPGRYGGLVSGEVGYILNFYTMPEARKIGICTRLMDELIDEGRRMGLTYFHLHATDDGEAIYRRAGFRDVELLEMELKLGSC